MNRPSPADWVRVFDGESTAGAGEAHLLARFADRRDQAAFAALVDRHGPMVLATCRRSLGDPHDADDAFQATFLVLARKAGRIDRPERLGPWLHAVARKVAARARRQATRRRRIEGAGAGAARSAPMLAPSDPLDELRSVLDEELARLPERLRAPLVLCYLEGLTHDQAADRLGWPVGTVRSRMGAGRDRLRGRLARRGFAPPTLDRAGPLPALPIVPLPGLLRLATIRLAVGWASAAGPARSAFSSLFAVSLARGALKTMTLHKIQSLALVSAAAAGTLLAGTAGFGRLQALDGDRPQALAALTPAAAAAKGPAGPESLAKAEAIGRDRERLATALIQVERGLAEVQSWDDAPSGVRARLYADRYRTEAQAIRRRLEDIPSEPIEVPDPLPPGQFSRDRLDRDARALLAGPPAELAGDPEYARALDAYRDRARPVLDAIRARLDDARQDPEPKPEVKSEPKPEVKPEPRVSEAEPKDATKGPRPAPKAELEPTLQAIEGATSLVMMVSRGRDRVTMIDPETRKQASISLDTPADPAARSIVASTLRFAMPASARNNRGDAAKSWQKFEELTSGMIGLRIIGPPTRHVALFDRATMTWAARELAAPAEGVQPHINTYSPLVAFPGKYTEPTDELVLHDAMKKTWPTLKLPRPISGRVHADVSVFGTASYEAGNFIGVYNRKLDKWATLELKRPPGEAPAGSTVRRVGQFQDDKLIIPEGDVVHIYDGETGEWADVDTAPKP